MPKYTHTKEKMHYEYFKNAELIQERSMNAN